MEHYLNDVVVKELKMFKSDDPEQKVQRQKKGLHKRYKVRRSQINNFKGQKLLNKKVKCQETLNKEVQS